MVSEVPDGAVRSGRSPSVHAALSSVATAASGTIPRNLIEIIVRSSHALLKTDVRVRECLPNVVDVRVQRSHVTSLCSSSRR